MTIPSTPTVTIEGLGIRAIRWVIIGTLAVLFLYSLHLAAHRIIQVDEAQNLYMAKIIGSGQTDTYFVNPSLFLLGPLAWIADSATSAKDAFLSGRLLFAGVFWLNIFLLVKCTGISLRTKEGLLVALAAATLAPLWDYGFEIRHDNLLLTGLLLIWYLARYRGDKTSAYFAIGLLNAILQFLAVKALVYTLPISAYLLVCRGVAEPTTLVKAFVAWFAGIVLGGLVCLLVYFSLGLPVALLGNINIAAATQVTHSNATFYPFDTLSRLLFQTPLLIAVANAALLISAMAAIRKPKAIFEQHSLMPEAVLLTIAIGALFINPTPFPYNLVNVVPFAFLLAYRLVRPILPVVSTNRPLLVLAASVFAFSHVVPFLHATLRHLNWNNWRQMRLIEAAEAMTDPTSDPVYDAAGLVLTRHSIDRAWYLHSLNMKQMFDGKQSSVAAMLAKNPAAVLMPNYRFDWLPESDWQFIRENYLPLADDFWVLGTQSPPGGGDFHTLRSGRYQVFPANGKWQQSPPDLAVDGEQVHSDILMLPAGTHTIKTAKDVPVTIIWLGPKLNGLPTISAGNHRTFFANWY
jgi:hypothetical protein